MVSGKSKGWFGSGLSGGNRFTQMNGIENRIGNFHKAQMGEQPPRIDHKVADDRTNELYYLNGGVMGVVPKPQPQGSFSRPLNMSGNTGHGVGLSGAGGTMRTQAGQRYGIALLKRRAKQLEQMDAIKSGLPLPAKPEELRKKVEEVPLTPAEEKNMNELETDMTEIDEKVKAGDINQLKVKNVSKAYNKLSTSLGQKLGAEKVNKYTGIVDNARRTLAGAEAAPVRPRSLALPLKKLSMILKCLKDTLNLQPAERAMYMKACRREADKLVAPEGDAVWAWVGAPPRPPPERPVGPIEHRVRAEGAEEDDPQLPPPPPPPADPGRILTPTLPHPQHAVRRWRHHGRLRKRMSHLQLGLWVIP